MIYIAVYSQVPYVRAYRAHDEWGSDGCRRRETHPAGGSPRKGLHRTRPRYALTDNKSIFSVKKKTRKIFKKYFRRLVMFAASVPDGSHFDLAVEGSPSVYASS